MRRRQKRQTDWLLFEVARCCVTIEKHIGEKLSEPEAVRIFNEWYEVALQTRFLRLERYRYLTKFMRVRKYARRGITEDNLQDAWKCANQCQLPAAAEMYFPDEKHERAQRITVALCRELQRDTGDPKNNAFYLSCRTVSELFGFNPKTNAARGDRILEALEACNIICLVKNGTRKLASEWIYTAQY